jgi:polyphenol oxidase
VTVAPVEPTVGWQLVGRPLTWDLEWITSTTNPQVTRYTWLNQCHGNRVVVVTRPGEHRGAVADAAVTDAADAVLVIRTADCAPVLFQGQRADGATLVGVAHAGWQGLANGIVEATAAHLTELGAVSLSGWLGPCIGPECYEFGEDGLQDMQARFGPLVRSTTSWGTPALNISEAVADALRQVSVTYHGKLPQWSCTACDEQRWYSHRKRRDTGRMALLASLGPIDRQPLDELNSSDSR